VSECPATATRLVGRDEDLAALTATLRSVQAGRMAAVVLCGEAGAGKTSLVEELTARAADEGAVLLCGTALDIAESPPFWPVASALRTLLAEGDPRVTAALAPWTAALDDLLGCYRSGHDGSTPRCDRSGHDASTPRSARGGRPAPDQMRGGRPAPDPTGGGPDGTARGAADAPGVQTLELLRGVVADLARRAPVVLVVEDLQWVDDSTRDLLVYLIANLVAEPVLLLVTYRSDAHSDTSATRAFIAELQRHRQVRCAEVRPLRRDAVARIVEQAAPGRPELVELVWSRSAGNAFIVGETLRAALEGEPHALPQTLRDLVLARVEALSPVAQRVVRAIAAAHGPLPHRLLAAVADAQQVAEPELLDALRESVERGVVVVDEGVVGEGYRLRHGLMTEVVARGLLPGERMALHRAYATALEGDRARGLPGVDARLAHHWQQAGDLSRALTAAVAAARAATRVHGHAEAHRHWLRAALLAGDLPAAGSGEAAAGPSREDCLEEAAQAAHLAGDHDQAVALLGERLADATDGSVGLSRRSRTVSDTVADIALLHARIGRYLVAAGRGVEATHAYRRATELLPADVGPARAEVLCGQAAALLHAGEYAASQEVAREALALVREVGPAGEEATVLATLGFGLAYLEDTAAGSAALAEALAVAERVGGPGDVARAYLHRAELLTGPLNEMERGIAVAREGLVRVRALGLARSSGVGLLSVVANGLFRLGRWDEAAAVIGEAWALHPTGVEAMELRLARCKVDMSQGRLAAAEDDLEAVGVLATGTAGPRYRVPLLTLRAGLEMWRGRPDLALEHVGAGLDVVERGSDDVWVVAPLVWHGARARAELARLGMRAADAAVTERLRRHVAQLARSAEDAVPGIRDVVLTFVAICAAEDSRVDGPPAPDAWAEVARRWEALQQPYPATYALLRQAEAAFAARARSAAGTEALRRAEVGATAMNAVPLLAEIRELAAHARVELHGPEQAPRAIPAPRGAEAWGDRDPLELLTTREREVLEVLAAGLTNREIAGRLFISEKTVGVHVGRIYHKLGVRGRVQATSLFRRARPA
jgi:DNA-binding CsgD family transcriptional regulator/tetratricopeptide (TPR) repeat protein